MAEMGKRKWRYWVVIDLDINKLTEEVERRLDGGWELHGGINVSHYISGTRNVTYFAQALILEVRD